MGKKTKTSTTKGRNPLLVEDERWKVKGGPHKRAIPIPIVCSTCKGLGTIIDINGNEMECPLCNGLGEVDG